MRFYRQEYIKRHDLFHGRTGPIRAGKNTQTSAIHTDHSMEIQADLGNIHGKLARFMAWPVLPVYARRLRPGHILSDKRYETSVEPGNGYKKTFAYKRITLVFCATTHAANFNCRANFLRSLLLPLFLLTSPRIFPSGLARPDLFGGVNFGLVSSLA